MGGLEVRNLRSPDETRTFPNGKMDLAHVGDVTIGLGEFQPGWRWSESVKPIVGGDSCQQHHAGYLIAGRMRFLMDDGTQAEIGPGDAFVIPPGHDAWTVGDETCLFLDCQGMRTYAQPS